MKKVHGKGIYDGYEESKTKAYVTWTDMLKRCYSKKYKNRLAYEDVEVCEEWLLFSTFRNWFMKNYKEGFVLDKDLKTQGARCYSPENCMFLPQKLNTLLINVGKARGYTNTKTKDIYNVSFTKFDENKRHNVGRVKGKAEANRVYRVNKFVYCTQVVYDYYQKGEIPYEVFEAVIKTCINILLKDIKRFPSDLRDFNKKYVLPKGTRYS